MRVSLAPIALALALGATGAISTATLSSQLHATEIDTLVIGKSGDPDNLDPAVTVTNNSWTATYPAYERLVKFQVVNGRGSTEVEPDIASSWSTSDDGRRWTFKIAKGHFFSDGTPVTSEAVKFSFERMMKIGKGVIESFSQLDHVETPDPETAVFVLKEPSGPFLAALASNGGSIVNPAVMQHEVSGDLGQAYLADHSMGSGAFQIASWEKDQQIVLTPNPHYGGKAPALKKIVIKIIKEATARRLQLEKGDIDLAEHIPIDQLSSLRKVSGVTVVDEPSFQVSYLYLNNKNPALSSKAVRQALSHAVDYQGIIQGILLGQGVQMRGAVPVGLWGHDENARQYNYDVAKAKAILAEAGIKNLKLGYLYAKTDPNWEQIGLVLQQNLAALGIEVELTDFAYPTMRDKLNRGDFDIAVGNWTPDYADPSMFMNFWFDSSLHGLPGNRAFYTNPKVDELIRKAATRSDVEERKALYKQAQEIVLEEAPYILLFQKNYQFAMRDSVKGFVYNPMLLQIFNFETMSKSQ